MLPGTPEPQQCLKALAKCETERPSKRRKEEKSKTSISAAAGCCQHEMEEDGQVVKLAFPYGVSGTQVGYATGPVGTETRR